MVKKNTKLTRILSIDGGGIKGIISGYILVSLERILKKIDNNPNGKISDYFDLIAGTSTGGILTSIYLTPDKYGKPKYSAMDAVNIYLKYGDKIFDISFLHRLKSGNGILDEKYDKSNLEKIVKQYFNDLMLSDLIKPCLITSYDIKNRKGHFFKSHKAKKFKTYNFKLRDVTRATSAAPTYFEIAYIKSQGNISYPLIDGGVFVNNPSMCAYAEARTIKFNEYKNKPKANNMALLSIGNGSQSSPYTYKKSKDWGIIKWINPIIDIMMGGSVDIVDYQLKQIFDTVDYPKQYLRINPDLNGASSDMDNVTNKNLKLLKESGIKNSKKFKDQLESFAELLINNK
jgi:patatin-like phospholipase/acyl hydrolase